MKINRVELRPDVLEACKDWIKEHNPYLTNGRDEIIRYYNDDRNSIIIVNGPEISSFPIEVLGGYRKIGLVHLYYLNISVLRLIITKQKILPLHKFSACAVSYDKINFTYEFIIELPEAHHDSIWVLGHND